MTSIFSPNNIEVLLWCHTRPAVHERFEAPAVQETLKKFLEMGAIAPWEGYPEGVFTTTPLGRAWVQALCNTPPPRIAFIDEQGRVIES